MEDNFEYELLNIEWELNYEFDLESPGQMVRDTTGDTEEEPKPSLVFAITSQSLRLTFRCKNRGFIWDFQISDVLFNRRTKNI